MNRSLAIAALATVLAASTLVACKRERPLPAQVAAPIPPAGAPAAAPAAGPAPVAPLPANPPPSAAAPAQAPGAVMEYQRRIAAAEQVVAQDPKNAQAWIQLGNDYFDTQQRQKAIDAYAHALELQPNNADVLTDQGVMYREVGAFDKAIANFTKANQVDPSHMQSLFNMGVVYAYDLKQPDKAIQAWNRIVEKSPLSPQAAQARQAIEDVKRRSGAPASR